MFWESHFTFISQHNIKFLISDKGTTSYEFKSKTITLACVCVCFFFLSQILLTKWSQQVSAWWQSTLKTSSRAVGRAIGIAKSELCRSFDSFSPRAHTFFFAASFCILFETNEHVASDWLASSRYVVTHTECWENTPKTWACFSLPQNPKSVFNQ